MRLKQILPRRDDRAFICGQTGCGKTTLVKVLLNAQPNRACWIFDYKGTIRLPGFKRFTKLEDMHRARPHRAIYAPRLAEMDDPDYHNAFFKMAYRRRNLIVYVDEVFSVTRGQYLPPYYKAILTRGREFHIALYTSTQRPKDIPTVVMSESQHKYIFFLNMEDDREKVEGFTGIPEEKIGALPDFTFYYAANRGYYPKPLTLDL